MAAGKTASFLILVLAATQAFPVTPSARTPNVMRTSLTRASYSHTRPVMEMEV